ncbi:MAG: dCTP deaminase [Candidatus Zhuqueibacterota bacterium]
MSILTRSEILKEINAGNISVTPLDISMIGPGSIDLHLGDTFRIFKKVHDIIDVNDTINYEEMTELRRAPEGMVLMPGETILGITLETIRLAPNICGWLEGRSRFARLGLLVHISASFMHPGIHNQQVLEMTNFSPMPLRIHPGTAICQFIFQKTIGEATYEGRFRNQLQGQF